MCDVDLSGGFPSYPLGVFTCQINMQSILFPNDAYQMSLRRRIAYLGYALIIILGTIPGARAEVGEVASGFFLHFVSYACMAALLFTGYRGTAGSRALRAVAIVAVMGALDEYIQSFLPYRNGTIRDWYVDVAAAITASLILAQLFVRARRRAIAVSQSTPGSGSR